MWRRCSPLRPPTSLAADLTPNASAGTLQVGAPSVARRGALVVVRTAKVKKVSQVVLKSDVAGLGQAGEAVTVSTGHFRNFLYPTGKADVATPEVLSKLAAEAASREAALKKEKDMALAVATSLRTLKNFTVKKKVNEDGSLYDSVTAAEVAAVIKEQTAADLDAKAIALPDISGPGTFEATVQLHPDVVGTFNVVVKKA